jgi:hypothetical protein
MEDKENNSRKERMVIEMDVLAGNMLRLAEFKGSELFKTLNIVARTLSRSQYEAMKEYLDILKKRYSRI